MRIGAILAIVTLLGGCCSVKISSQGNHDMVEIQNRGWKLFSCIPIASGDPNYPNGEVANWFENTVTLKTNLQLLDDAARKGGYHGFRDLTSFTTEETIFPILLKRYTYHTSAELLK